MGDRIRSPSDLGHGLRCGRGLRDDRQASHRRAGTAAACRLIVQYLSENKFRRIRQVLRTVAISAILSATVISISNAQSTTAPKWVADSEISLMDDLELTRSL